MLAELFGAVNNSGKTGKITLGISVISLALIFFLFSLKNNQNTPKSYAVY